MNKKEIIAKSKKILGKKIKHALGVAEISTNIAKKLDINIEKI
jgi:HD superfamily phosphohydrolase YqeK